MTDIHKALATLGFRAFRGIQEKAITAFCEGHDVFGMMATSGGKSLCYQLPAFALPGYSLVISPLIALMNDQADGMRARGIPAAALTPDVPLKKKLELIQTAGQETKCLFLSPELMEVPHILDALKRNPPSRAVMDEAHCISTWGADFRPSYMRVGELISSLSRKRIPRMALTATASQEAISDILHYGHFKNPVILTQSLVRDNIQIFMKPSIGSVSTNIINDCRYFAGQSGIIYCQRRKDVDALYHDLTDAGLVCAKHHSGMRSEERRDAAIQFMNGSRRIMIATMGFGMGIDKADVRFVIHHTLSATPENWFQEIGRGGRDGKPCHAISYVPPGISQSIRLSTLNRSCGWGIAREFTQVALGTQCRMAGVMALFGEQVPPCGHCDVCLGHASPQFPSSDNGILEAIREHDVSPLKIAKMMGSEDHWLRVQDKLFMNGFLDYSSVPRGENLPPSARLSLTAAGWKAVKDNETLTVMTPEIHPEPVYPLTREGRLHLVQSRSHYDNLKLPEGFARYSVALRPSAENMREKLHGFPERLVELLAPKSAENTQSKPAYQASKTIKVRRLT